MSALVLLPGEGKAVQIGGEGLGVVFKLFSTDTEGRFAVVEHPLAPGILAGPSHIHHQEDEASYVLEGEIMAQIGDQLNPGTCGDIGLQAQGDPPYGLEPRLSSGPHLGDHLTRRALSITLKNWLNWSHPMVPPDIPSLMNLAQKYNLELDMSSVTELSQKYHVSLGRPGQPT